MSKGISKLQRAIKGILEGTVQRRVYSGGPGEMITAELVDEMVEAGLVKEATDKASKRAAMFTVWRACDSLCRRGLIGAGWGFTDGGDRTVTWKPAANQLRETHSSTSVAT